ncbi:MAG: hypothetical protein ACJAXA_003690 [Candidatus Aldehydirespiratoraceae bacterium]|jgi:hypothetical protein
MFGTAVTREADCTQGRVSQVMREVENATKIEKPVGQRVMFRQLFGEEEAWRTERNTAQDTRLRRREMQRVRSRLTEPRDAVEELLIVVDCLAAKLEAWQCGETVTPDVSAALVERRSVPIDPLSAGAGPPGVV